MAESSTITREGGRSGRQLKLRALDGDVFEGALLEASKPNNSIRLLMTAQNYQCLAVVDPTHAAARPHLPKIFRVDHFDPPRRPPTTQAPLLQSGADNVFSVSTLAPDRQTDY
ncbi:hypothetical protein ACLBYG_08110 [Methylobacterium sp. D53M]